MIEPRYKSDKVELYCADCLDVLPQLEPGSVDLCLADPPYHKIASEDWDDQWRDIFAWSDWCKRWGLLICNLLRDNGSAYLFGDDKNIAYMQVVMDQLDWGLINHIVWSKTNYTALKADPYALRSYAVQAEERILFYGKDITFPSFSQIRNPKAAQPMAEYMRSERVRAGISAKEIAKLFPSATGGLTGCVSNWELGLNFPTPEQYQKIRDYLNKSGEYEYMRREYEDMRRPFYGNRFTDVWVGASINGGAKYHPSQKPDWIIKRIVHASTDDGNLILDPFMGSGTTGVACMQTGRKFIGVEIDPTYYAIAEKRIRQAEAQLLLGI